MESDCIKQGNPDYIKSFGTSPFSSLLVSIIWYGGHKQLIKSLLSHTNLPLKISMSILCWRRNSKVSCVSQWNSLHKFWSRKKKKTKDKPNYDLRRLCIKVNGFSGITSSLCECHIDQNFILDLTFFNTKSSKKKKKIYLCWSPPIQTQTVLWFYKLISALHPLLQGHREGWVG